MLYQEDGADPLTDMQFNRLREEVDARHTGAGAAGRPLLLEGGLKWQEMGMSPKDMDWLSGRDMNAREIALAFGVPPQMIGIPGSQTYANYAEARLSLYEDTVIPHVREIVSELNAWLIPMFEEADAGYRNEGTLSLSLDLDDVPALEPKRAAKFDRLTRADFMTANEKRSALGLASIDGGDEIGMGNLGVGSNSGDISLKSSGRFHVLAPPRFFGPWQQVWSQFGVAGNDDTIKQRIKINFESMSDAPSSFDVEISGGDRFIRTAVPGSGFVYVTVSGNVATAITVRFRSHTLGQKILVTL